MTSEEINRFQQLVTATMSQDQFLRMKCMEMAISTAPHADPEFLFFRAKVIYRVITEDQDWSPQDRR